MFFINEKEEVLTITPADFCDSPREYSISKFYTFMRRYSSPDTHKYSSFENFLKSYHCRIKFTGPDSLPEIQDFFLRKKILLVPVYAYIHSGICYSTTPFSCPWDSGLAGVIFCTFDDIRMIFDSKSIKNITKKILNEAKVILDKEVKRYNAYANGELYQYEICDKNGVTIDACSGYIGSDIMENGMYEDLPDWQPILDCYQS